MNHSIHKIITAILLTVTVVVLSACSVVETVKPNLEQKRQEEESETGYTAAQMYLVLAGRHGEVEAVYTDQIFDITVSDHGTKYEDSYRESVRDYLEKIHLMTEMARESGIALDAVQKKNIDTKADEFMSVLEDSGNAAGVTKKDVSGIIGDMCLIRMLRENIMAESNVEVSESEARVADIIRIELDTSDKAVQVLAEADEGADFGILARKYSENAEIELKVGRGDLPKALDEAVFLMEDDEISPIIQTGEKYYIVKCVKGYDEEATSLRKEKLSLERQSKAIGARYEAYASEHEYELDNDEWKKAAGLFDENHDVPDIFEYTV